MHRVLRSIKGLVPTLICGATVPALSASCGAGDPKNDPTAAGSPAASVAISANAVPVSWLSTERIAQLTGNYDPEDPTNKKGHFTDTTAWGVNGVDLGANTEHHGRTLFFFGDVSGPLSEGQDLMASVGDVSLPRGAHIATARQGTNQLDAFFIGNDGALYVSWIEDGRFWQGPHRISDVNLAPPGAALATAKQSDDQLDVFVIGKDGGLHVSSVVGKGNWSAPYGISQGEAPPGARLAAAKQTDNQLDVFFIGNDNKLHIRWAVGNEDWTHLHVVSDGPRAPAGAAVTTIQQDAHRLAVLFVGEDKNLYAPSVVDLGEWGGFESKSRGAVAPAGGYVAAIQQAPGLVTALFIDNDHKLSAQWSTNGNSWDGPTPVSSAPGVAPPGGGIALVQSGGTTHAVYTGDHGELFVQTAKGAERWSDPQIKATANTAPAGAPIAGGQQTDAMSVAIYSGPTNELQVSWLEAGKDWQGPARMNPDMLNLRPTSSSDGKYYPFTICESAQPNPTQPKICATPREEWKLLGGQTPTGAFSYNDKVYVFYVEKGHHGSGSDTYSSSLTVSSKPSEPAPFQYLFKLSTAENLSGKFMQVAPSVVRNVRDRFPGFPDFGTADGVFLFGQAETKCLGPNPCEHYGAISLAYLPLPSDKNQDPELTSIRYYTGSGWSTNQDQATPLVRTKFSWSSLSVGQIPGTNLWILLNHTAGSRKNGTTNQVENSDGPIEARVATTPWGLMGDDAKISLLDPTRDGTYRYSFRQKSCGNPDAYIPDCTTGPDSCDPNNLKCRGTPYDHIGDLAPHPAFLYGPYLLNKYTQYDAVKKVVTLNYIVSTGMPYQVQLMRSTIQIQ